MQSDLGDIYVDGELTEEMENEGYSRELIRRIQQARKDAGLTKEQMIEILIHLPDPLKQLNVSLQGFIVEIKSKVGAVNLEFVDNRPSHFGSEAMVRIKGENVGLFLTVASGYESKNPKTA
jgi:hypothetical protein